MPLRAYLVCFGEPTSDFVVDFLDVLDPKGVEMIARRKSFDAPESRIFQTAREDDVAVDPVSPDHKSGEAHSNMERDPRFFRQNRQRAIRFGDAQQCVENFPDRLRFTVEVGAKPGAAASVRLVTVGECPPAFRATPKRKARLSGSDSSSGNGRARCDN
ncbi:MAG TPA: hypothetical protein VM940_10595 [Chthoniobacterales bacterium]|jgi:hypothetical protein|nr:hypothetical protein [Chthoniobacterales bacterium]